MITSSKKRNTYKVEDRGGNGLERKRRKSTKHRRSIEKKKRLKNQQETPALKSGPKQATACTQLQLHRQVTEEIEVRPASDCAVQDGNTSSTRGGKEPRDCIAKVGAATREQSPDTFTASSEGVPLSCVCAEGSDTRQHVNDSSGKKLSGDQGIGFHLTSTTEAGKDCLKDTMKHERKKTKESLAYKRGRKHKDQAQNPKEKFSAHSEKGIHQPQKVSGVSTKKQTLPKKATSDIRPPSKKRKNTSQASTRQGIENNAMAVRNNEIKGTYNNITADTVAAGDEVVSVFDRETNNDPSEYNECSYPKSISVVTEDNVVSKSSRPLLFQHNAPSSGVDDVTLRECDEEVRAISQAKIPSGVHAVKLQVQKESLVKQSVPVGTEGETAMVSAKKISPPSCPQPSGQTGKYSYEQKKSAPQSQSFASLTTIGDSCRAGVNISLSEIRPDAQKCAANVSGTCTALPTKSGTKQNDAVSFDTSIANENSFKEAANKAVVDGAQDSRNNYRDISLTNPYSLSPETVTLRSYQGVEEFRTAKKIRNTNNTAAVSTTKTMTTIKQFMPFEGIQADAHSVNSGTHLEQLKDAPKTVDNGKRSTFGNSAIAPQSVKDSHCTHLMKSLKTEKGPCKLLKASERENSKHSAKETSSKLSLILCELKPSSTKGAMLCKHCSRYRWDDCTTEEMLLQNKKWKSVLKHLLTTCQRCPESTKKAFQIIYKENIDCLQGGKYTDREATEKATSEYTHDTLQNRTKLLFILTQA